jgi:cytochrome c553
VFAATFAVFVGTLWSVPVRAAEPSFQAGLRPILQARCVKCHGLDEKSGNVNFAAIADNASAARQRRLWRKAVAQLEAGAMPPQEAPQLTADEKQRLLVWMKQTIENVDCNDPANRDPGPAVIRRLSLSEYNRTIRDLLGFEFDAATVGMTSEAGEGNTFGNLAAALDVPPAQMEKYFAAADQIFDRFFGTELSSSVDGRIQEQARNSREQMFQLKPGDWRKVDYEVAPPPGVEPRDAALSLITAFVRRAYRGQATPTDIGRLMAIYDRAAGLKKSYGDTIRVMLKAVLVSPKFLFRIEQDDVPGGRGSRRADTGENAGKNEGGSAGASPSRGPADEIVRVSIVPVSDHELAVRLSYFLWSSMPDDELLELADRGRLTVAGPSTEPVKLHGKPISAPGSGTVLEQQVRRMLADPRARSLTDNFAVHWLQIHKLPAARPSTEFFPEFNANVRQAMFDETSLFFDTLRREDRSVLELLDADYTFVNDELAKYYGLPDVQGKELRRVTLKPEDHRGGLLGMGSMLAVTSHTSRTSPTMRGKWILEVVFGTPPPPPPANVSQIKDEPGRKKGEIQTFRDKLSQHAHDAACAACHRKMDPLGFALDNFDAVGRWRDKLGDQPLDVTGELPTGEKLNGVGDLKRVILSRKEEFVRNLSEQLLTYALGRELEDCDDCPTRQIVMQLRADDYQFSTLVMEIVKSYPFQYRRYKPMIETE